MRALVDTGALLALSRRQDQYHARAVEIAERHLAAGGQYVGPTLILGELHSHLLYLRGPKEGRVVLSHLLSDPVHAWLDVSADLVHDAVTNWLARFADRRFSLVDAVSFEVMRRERLSHAFAFDEHFEVAGFELLRSRLGRGQAAAPALVRKRQRPASRPNKVRMRLSRFAPFAVPARCH